MADGDYYEIIDKQAQGGQTILNVYVYRAAGVDSNATDIANTFATDLIPQIASLQSSSLSHVQLTVNNLNDLTDFHVQSLSVVGGQAADCLPPQDAVALFYQRTTRASRNGWKRFAGVPEAHQNNGALDSTIITSWATIASDLLGPVISSVATVTLTPYIWRRPRTGVLQAFFPVADITVIDFVTTQNTRKYNRGI